MSKYVDGFVLPLPKNKVEVYRNIAENAAKIWREHGALEYRECALEDPTAKECVPFPQLANVKPDETVIFAWIVYESRAHRDEVNAKVMADPRITEMSGEESMPFDGKRMAYGGFETLVEA